jgi:tyrosine-protein kinase Etk/Wzc
LAKLTVNASSDGDIQVPTRDVPEAGLEYLRGFRDVKYHETVFELLSRQFELAKIDEARDSSLIQVLDQAVVPEKKSKPHRSWIALAGLIFGFLLGVGLALLRDFFQRASENNLLLDELRQQLTFDRKFGRFGV